MLGIAPSCGHPELPRLTGDNVATDASPDHGASSDGALPNGPPSDGVLPDGPLPDGPPPQSLNCTGVAATCGAGANESCCKTEAVPGGTFYRSYDGAGYNDMAYPATVSTFVLDVYEVTVGRFRTFVNAGRGTQASPPAMGAGAHSQIMGSGWDTAWTTSLAASTAGLIAGLKCSTTYQTWTDSPGGNENKPINCVNWFEAMAFCVWDGGYLPTEAEWNYAASGGGEQRVYPWSNPANSTTIDCTYVNYTNDYGNHCVMGGINWAGSKSVKGNGRWNHSDLAGNVAEWTLDWYSGSYQMPCNNCANLPAATERIHRGGSFSNQQYGGLRAADRSYTYPTARSYLTGFRCARKP